MAKQHYRNAFQNESKVVYFRLLFMMPFLFGSSHFFYWLVGCFITHFEDTRHKVRSHTLITHRTSPLFKTFIMINSFEYDSNLTEICQLKSGQFPFFSILLNLNERSDRKEEKKWKAKNDRSVTWALSESLHSINAV